MDFVSGTFQGHVILSQFPLTAYDAIKPNTTASHAIGHCSVLINGKEVHLFAGTDQGATASETAVKPAIPTGADFIFFYHNIGNVKTKTTYADQSVTVAYDSVNTGMILSTTGMTYGGVTSGKKDASLNPLAGIDAQYVMISFK